MDWTAEKAREAEATLRKWRAMTDGVEAGEVAAPVLACLADDLNTAGAVAELHKLAASGDTAALKASGLMMGLLDEDLGSCMNVTSESVELKQLSELLAEILGQRAKAKMSRDFQVADRIRDQLRRYGVQLLDSKEGTTWQLAPEVFEIESLEAAFSGKEAEVLELLKDSGAQIEVGVGGGNTADAILDNFLIEIKKRGDKTYLGIVLIPALKNFEGNLQ
jgi:cysteinyl-tRNA synthetase